MCVDCLYVLGPALGISHTLLYFNLTLSVKIKHDYYLCLARGENVSPEHLP
jgi:hypothetical protein